MNKNITFFFFKNYFQKGTSLVMEMTFIKLFFKISSWVWGQRGLVGAAQAHTPSTKNYAVEIPTWSILRDLQHHMTTSVKCNGLLLPWTTALLIAVEPQPGKYALPSSPLQTYTIHKPAHLSYFIKRSSECGKKITGSKHFVGEFYFILFIFFFLSKTVH